MVQMKLTLVCPVKSSLNLKLVDGFPPTYLHMSVVEVGLVDMLTSGYVGKLYA